MYESKFNFDSFLLSSAPVDHSYVTIGSLS